MVEEPNAAHPHPQHLVNKAGSPTPAQTNTSTLYPDEAIATQGRDQEQSRCFQWSLTWLAGQGYFAGSCFPPHFLLTPSDVEAPMPDCRFSKGLRTGSVLPPITCRKFSQNAPFPVCQAAQLQVQHHGYDNECKCPRPRCPAGGWSPCCCCPASHCRCPGT